MITFKKKFTVKIPGKKPVVVTRTRIAAKDILFPEKLAKANSILPKIKWLPDQ